ncbi:MAG: LysR substrate-binding domain-containing protein [Marinobacterium sp.]|nr:LysR substrate-binding domain-containing protein [Marinobacterium sp.]
MQRLRQMSIFAHIVDAGSISAAADRLDLSKSVVSQHLKTLESELGLPLLRRTTRRQTLTTTGEHFYQQCQQLNTLADNAWQQALESQQSPSGTIRITAPHALMSTLIAPALSELLALYPALTPELISSDRKLDLTEERIDLAIRVGNSEGSTLRQRRIGEFRDVLCGKPTCTPDSRYIANHWQGNPIQHRFEACSGTTIRQTTIRQIEYTPGCRTDSFHSCLALIEAGAGIGLVPDFILRQRPTQLIEMLPGYQLAACPIYALHPYGTLRPTAVERCIEAIEQKLNGNWPVPVPDYAPTSHGKT